MITKREFVPILLPGDGIQLGMISDDVIERYYWNDGGLWVITKEGEHYPVARCMDMDDDGSITF